MIVVMMVVLVIASVLLSGGGSGKITTGRLVGTAERMSATGLALKQLRLPVDYVPPAPKPKSGKAKPKKAKKAKSKSSSKNPPKPIPSNRVTMWVGNMPTFWWGGRFRGLGATLQTMFSKMPAVWIPDMQRSALVVGSPGSGKTFTAIDRMIESCFAQGMTTIIYDKKGDQMKLHVPLAMRYGYQVHIFAPGESFSGVLNPLDFMKDGTDAVMAGQLGYVINRNAKEGGGGKGGDEFFSKAGDLLAKGLMQLSKSTKYPDMAMVYSILRLPGLVHRIDYAVQTGVMDEWIASSFIQFLSAKDSEKTISGIITTAAATFSGFIQKDLLGTFIGDSTIPTKVEGKHLIVFKLDDERRSVIGPLVAAAIHMSVVKNLTTKRETPLAVFLDELPSIRLDALPQWINEYRSNGGCFILGIQSLNQLAETYGDKMGDAIASACATHFLFYPGDVRTAETYSKRFGEKEVEVTSESQSRNMGVNTSNSTSKSKSLQKMPMFTVDEILGFTEGQCVITNPGYRSGLRGMIPYFLKVPVSKAEENRAKETEALWDTDVRPYLDSLAQKIDPALLMAGLQDRIEEADRILPLPPDMVEGGGKAQPQGQAQVKPPVVPQDKVKVDLSTPNVPNPTQPSPSSPPPSPEFASAPQSQRVTVLKKGSKG